jgi:hypothetical protein
MPHPWLSLQHTIGAGPKGLNKGDPATLEAFKSQNEFNTQVRSTCSSVTITLKICYAFPCNESFYARLQEKMAMQGCQLKFSAFAGLHRTSMGPSPPRS